MAYAKSQRVNKTVRKESYKDERVYVMFRINFVDSDLLALLCRTTRDTGLRRNSGERVVN